MRRSWLARAGAGMAVAALAVAGCGGGGGGGGDDPTVGGGPNAAGCAPSGTALSIAADDIHFDKRCLAAPAGQELTIVFDNREAVPHNVEIRRSKGSSSALFSGQIVTGPKTVTYTVPPLPAGTYRFVCSVHPTQMDGTFVAA